MPFMCLSKHIDFYLKLSNNDFQYIAPKYNYPLSDRKNDLAF